MNKISMQVDQKSILEAMKYSFSKPAIVLQEMAQNAYRAKAKSVDIELEGDTLIISDNGTTPMDFKALLSIGKSGWDAETIQKENPFGVGFLSAIHSGEHITIQSEKSLLDAKTQDLLDGKEVPVTSLEDGITGTCIKLTLNAEMVEKVRGELNRRDLFSGFPIPVFITIDGGERKQPSGKFSIPSLEDDDNFFMHSFEDGTKVFLHIGGKEEYYYHPLTNYTTYCQGFLVGSHTISNTIIHAGNDFNPVFPDRNRFYDSDNTSEKLEKLLLEAIKECIVAYEDNIEVLTRVAERYFTTSIIKDLRSFFEKHKAQIIREAGVYEVENGYLPHVSRAYYENFDDIAFYKLSDEEVDKAMEDISSAGILSVAGREYISDCRDVPVWAALMSAKIPVTRSNFVTNAFGCESAMDDIQIRGVNFDGGDTLSNPMVNPLKSINIGGKAFICFQAMGKTFNSRMSFPFICGNVGYMPAKNDVCEIIALTSSFEDCGESYREEWEESAQDELFEAIRVLYMDADAVVKYTLNELLPQRVKKILAGRECHFSIDEGLQVADVTVK